MGVKGLTVLIRHNQTDLLSDIHLRDTKVVIDGNNLYHHLYESFHVCKQYGGNYDAYSDIVRFFFEELKTCKISPYVVFDGAHGDERKLKTLLNRARSSIKENDKLCSGHASHIIPILTYQTFRAVLVDLGIPHVSCDFEADDQMVVLANELNCPIISDDSDFFVFNIKAGFIPLKSIRLKVRTYEKSKYKYLSAKLYFAEELEKRLPSVQGSILPLFATLLGNDFFDENSLEEFFETLEVPSTLKSGLAVPSERTRTLSIIHWLENLDCNIELAIDKIVLAVQKNEKESVKAALEESVKRYSKVESYASFNLLEFLREKPPTKKDELPSKSVCPTVSDGLDYNCLSTSVSDHDKAIARKNGSFLPSWFCYGHRKALFPSSMLNVIISNRKFLKCGIEKIDELSSFECCTRLRQITYGILKAGTPDMTDDQGVPTEEAAVQEYSRVKRNLASASVLPLFKVSKYGDVPTLEEVVIVLPEQRRSLIFYSLDLKNEVDIVAFPENLKLVAATIIYWMQNSKPKPTHNNVKSLLVFMLIRSLKLVLSGIVEDSQKIIETIENNFKDYYLEWKIPGAFGVDMDKVHVFSQFQTCIEASTALNQLLMYPLISPSPSDYFNGTFVYNLTADLNERPDACENLYNLISNEDVFQVLESWVAALYCYENEDAYTDVKRRVKGKHKKKKRKQKRCSIDKEETARKQLSLTNRFVGLGVDVSD